MSRIYKVRPNNITESFLPGDESWGPCNLCGGPTIDDQCEGDCCLGPANTARCLDCGHYAPLVGVLYIKDPTAVRPWPVKFCPCQACNPKGVKE